MKTTKPKPRPVPELIAERNTFAIQEYVSRLDVPVHQALVMCSGQRIRDLDGDAHR